MKKYAKELMILLLQALLFYIYPAIAIPVDPMGAVFLMLLATCVLSLVLGILSPGMLKWGYPALCSLLFLPTVPIYYNSSALVHSTWYLVVSVVGLLAGSGLAALWRKLRKKA